MAKRSLKSIVSSGLGGLRNSKPQNVTRGNGVKNPQKATAYVGKGVLRNGDSIPAIKGAITPVPNGHLIKKDGTSLKNGGKLDALSKVKDSISRTMKGQGLRDRRNKDWMDREKKKLSKVQPIKKR